MPIENATLKSVNPFDGKTLKTYDEMTSDAVEAAIGKANDAFTQWRETTYEYRAGILRRVAEILRERREALATIMTIEMGKKIGDSRPEIDLCAAIFDYYADNGGGEPPRGMRASAAFCYVNEDSHARRLLLAEMPRQPRKLRKSFANRCIDIGISRNITGKDHPWNMNRHYEYSYPTVPGYWRTFGR